eukprot:TRINITY_DN4284_c0_g1_i13.p1 TRINITY_DN4284_c0_g1~~TRINITY_DN4284_c0_g1_i13.p1  ORF type:complete len:275 (+),score=47.63 TRINITY_DN4284_c0_g1_i13:158-982(+)
MLRSLVGSEMCIRDRYKLVYAYMLAEYGFVDRARSYLDTVKRLGRACEGSGWRYHGLHAARLDALDKRLAPPDTKGSGGVLGRLSSLLSFGSPSKEQPVMDVRAQPAPTPQPAPVAQPAPSAASPKEEAPKKAGFFSSVVASITGGAPSGAGAPDDQLTDDTDMYYNNELGRWVERGKEDEPTEADAPPPPMAMESAQTESQGNNTAGETTGLAAMMAPPAPATSGERRSRLKNLRYVDPFSGAAAASNTPAVPGGAPPAASTAEKPKITMMSF